MRDQRSHINKMAIFLYMTWLVMEINRHLLVNKDGDLYFSLHNFGALIILFLLKSLKEIC